MSGLLKVYDDVNDLVRKQAIVIETLKTRMKQKGWSPYFFNLMPSSDNEINDLNSEFQEAKEEYLDDIRQSSRENDLLQSLLSTVHIYHIDRLSVI